MSQITVENLLENGVHFGHRASRWNPKMARYIHGKRNAIHIIDLKETVRGLVRATHYLEKVTAEGGKVLWVGTKRSAKEAIRTVARRTGHPFVTERWLGGTLTNFRTIRSRLGRLTEIEDLETRGILSALKKKEQARIRNERKKLLKNLEGIRDLERLPACLVIVDPKSEHIAVAEANKMRIPVIAILDTDCDPDVVDVAIPGNDDAMRSVSTLLDLLAAGVEEGAKAWAVVEAEQQRAVEKQREEAEQRRQQERQRQQVTEEWQHKLREDAERGGDDAGADQTPAAVAPQGEASGEEGSTAS
ncbi:MAG: 30S ribosomal protein S2 [Planctomycetota bacterium]|nr:30S ribosomal protein S2 [Planctomycetota bacterium]